ncbi:MAG: hypothetical protein IIT54_03795 [Acetobacter sp.]|nr:hypothetical protein [Acetobacter sp.]
MKVKNTLKFLLSISLFVSLSGCSMFYGDHRTHYPKATFETCYKNPQIQRDEDAGLERLGFFSLGNQRVLEGPNNNLHIGYVSGVQQLETAIQAFKVGNAAPLNAIYTQITPKALSNFMIACNNLTIHSVNTALTDVLKKGALGGKMSAWQQYLNTTTAPQPTLFLTKPRTGTCSDQYAKSHPEVTKSVKYVFLMYEMKPFLNSNLSEIMQAAQTDKLVAQIEKKAPGNAAAVQAFLNNNPNSANSGTAVVQKALLESENGNWTDLIAIFQQVQPPQWRHFLVGCGELRQKYHLKNH